MHSEQQEGENFPLFEVFHILHSWQQQQLQQSGTQEVSEGPNLKSLCMENDNGAQDNVARWIAACRKPGIQSAG